MTHYHWVWDLASSPDILWPYASDTNRFNRDTGLPTVEDLRPAQADLENARRHLRLFRLGMPVEWEEQPFEWVRPERFSVMRRYSAGPVASMLTTASLQPLAAGGTRLTYDVQALPRNLLGRVAIPLQIGLISRRSFEAVFRRYDRQASLARAALSQPATVQLAPGGAARLAELSKGLVAKGVSPEIAMHMTDTIERADDVVALHLRPYALADAWGLSRRATLEAFLWATRLGVLDFQWDVLCPLCRGAKQTVTSLKDMATQVHCEVCQIDYSANFDRSVELSFRPNRAIRTIDIGEYCVGGPQVTPHIMAQQLLAAGEKRTLMLPLEAGRYRMRALGLRGGQFLTAAAEGQADVPVILRDEEWGHDEPQAALKPIFYIENQLPAEHLFILERMAWGDQAVTAAEVTATQLFRDLFANEALRPDARISVGSLTVLFTDLRDSTRLYRQIGDAVAFGHVMTHFDVLRQAIVAEDGALVKTIGDAVMAMFHRPINALRAILAAQQALRLQTESAAKLVLKAGVHHGPCIAVTQNERLDYFGSTVNIAARVQNLSAGDDVVITAAVHDDPEVAAWLVEHAHDTTAQPFETGLKGLEDQFKLWRLSTLGPM